MEGIGGAGARENGGNDPDSGLTRAINKPGLKLFWSLKDWRYMHQLHACDMGWYWWKKPCCEGVCMRLRGLPGGRRAIFCMLSK